MSGAIRCPECGSSEVSCTSNPHDHQCHACGYSMLGGKCVPKIGDTVQVQEWIGTVESIDSDGFYEVEWGWFGGPLGSARTTHLPAHLLHIREAES